MKKFSIRVVIPTTKLLKDFEKTVSFFCIDSSISFANKTSKDQKIILDIVSENKIGLSELYQSKLDSSSEDYILFMHDDLEIHDKFLFEKLLKAHELYDVVGLAGATSQNYNKNVPPVWHLSAESPQDARGMVCHYIPKNFAGAQESHVNSVYFGPTPAEVVVIDGLFMSFKNSALKNKPAIFNKTFSFHFYDLAACYNAKINDLKIGVFPIFCIHHGLGDYNNDPLWHELSVKFKQHYTEINKLTTS